MTLLGQILSEIHYRLQGTPFEKIPGARTAYRKLIRFSGVTVVHDGIQLETLSDSNTHYANGYEADIVQLVQNRVSPGDTVLELGCSLGYFTTLFSKIVTSDGLVVGYEINKKRYEILKNNLKRNNCHNVTVYNLGVASKSHNTDSQQKEKSSDNEYVALDEHLTVDPDFVKIDIEGAEYEALLGMKQLLSKDRPVIVCEVHPDKMESFGNTTDDLFKFLDEIEYDIYRVNEDDIEKVTGFGSTREHYLFQPN